MGCWREKELPISNFKEFSIIQIFIYRLTAFQDFLLNQSLQGFPGGTEVKASACNVGDLGSIPGSGRSPGEENGNPLQYSYLENPMEGGACWATVHGVAKSQTQLSNFTFTCKIKAMVFPVKKAEHWRIDAFELWCWRRLLRVPWTARRSNQSILKEISPGCSLEDWCWS